LSSSIKSSLLKSVGGGPMVDGLSFESILEFEAL